MSSGIHAFFRLAPKRQKGLWKNGKCDKSREAACCDWVHPFLVPTLVAAEKSKERGWPPAKSQFSCLRLCRKR